MYVRHVERSETSAVYLQSADFSLVSLARNDGITLDNMKIRIKGNSVRLRLSKSEVDSFGEQGYVEEQTQFGSTALTYALQRYNGEQMKADFTDGKVTMYLPEQLAEQWKDERKVGFDAMMPLPGGNELYLLLEKDFKCLDATGGEDQSDNYDNPLAAQYNNR